MAITQIDARWGYDSFTRSGDLHVLIYDKEEHVATSVCSAGGDPKQIALAWINRPPEPEPEKVYTETEVTQILREKKYLNETQTFDDLPVNPAAVIG